MKKSILLSIVFVTITIFYPISSDGQKLKKLKEKIAKSAKAYNLTKEVSEQNTTEVKDSISIVSTSSEKEIIVEPEVDEERQKQAIEEIPYPASKYFTKFSTSTLLGIPFLSSTRNNLNSILALWEYKRAADIGLFDKSKLLTSREIASKLQWLESSGVPSKSQSEWNAEEKRLMDGYIYDTFLKKVLDKVLIPEKKKEFFISSDGSGTRGRGGHAYYQGPSWGGNGDPFEKKAAYEKFLASGIIDQLTTDFKDVPTEGVITINASISSYDFMSSSFKITINTNDVSIPGFDKNTDDFVYKMKVSEDEASKIKFPEYVVGILYLKISDFNEDWAMSQVKENFKLDGVPSGKFEKTATKTVVDFFRTGDFSEKIFSIDLAECDTYD